MNMVETNWRELEDRVRALFAACGCSAEKRIIAGPGNVKYEIDCLVTFEILGLETKWIVECKDWKNRVPQTVAGALRQLVTDVGADKGILVCPSGFQKGTFNQAEISNLTLITPDELEEKLLAEYQRLAGAYPVGQKLLEREENFEHDAMEGAKARGDDPEKFRITPERFYTFRSEASWLGVFRDWDAPRIFHVDLVAKVLQARGTSKRCPAAAIIGPGGSGKSVALQRLGVDLAEQGFAVWWVEEAERLLRYGLSELVAIGVGPHFLLIDEIQRLGDEDARAWRQAVDRNQSLVIVVAGRKLPGPLQASVDPGDGLFQPDEAADHISILDKIAEVMPRWADAAQQLKAEPLRQARLIRLLAVLARSQVSPRSLAQLEEIFLNILADDVNRIRNTLPGLADAVIDAAAIREAGRDMSSTTFVALAHHYQREASLPTLLKEVPGNPRWEVMGPLLSWDQRGSFQLDEAISPPGGCGTRNVLAGSGRCQRILRRDYRAVASGDSLSD